MNRVAMKTLVYLDDHVTQSFGFSVNRSMTVKDHLTKEDFYDVFTMTGTLFDFSGEQVFWIGMDIGGISPLLHNAIYQRLTQVTDSLKPDNLIVSGTHTHSGPQLTRRHFRPGMEDPTPEDVFQPFVDHIADVAAELYQQSAAQLQAYTAQISVVPIKGVWSNRNSLSGPCDKNVVLVRFLSKSGGEPIGLWFEMATHSTVVFPKNPKMTTDLVGNIRIQLASHYGCPVMPLVGCAGDSSTRLTRRRTSDSALDYGELLRLTQEAVVQITAQAKFAPLVIDRFAQKQCRLEYAYSLDPQALKRCLVRLEQQIAEQTNEQQTRLLVQSKESLIQRINGPYDVSGQLVGRAYDFGELKIGVAPGELVASLGLSVICHKSHDHRLVIGYTKDGVGYLVERQEYGKNFESINSNIPAGLPEVITGMIGDMLESFSD